MHDTRDLLLFIAPFTASLRKETAPFVFLLRVSRPTQTLLKDSGVWSLGLIKLINTKQPVCRTVRLTADLIIFSLRQRVCGPTRCRLRRSAAPNDFHVSIRLDVKFLLKHTVKLHQLFELHCKDTRTDFGRSQFSSVHEQVFNDDVE